ncbi:MAG: hypothetical protein LBM60_06415 [Clostridium sp.]|jgi:hypothetical protein|nr:hypothetical protein [Clostridium sp.]
MQLLQYIEYTALSACIEADKAKLLCFFRLKETGETRFTMPVIIDLFLSCGFSAPNASRLRDKLIKGKTKAFLQVKGSKAEYEFVPVKLQSLNKEYGTLWEDTETIVSDSELIDEVKFCNKRNDLDRIIRQINHCYAHNCYDACAVLMRRLFEILLVLSYQRMDIDAEIKDRDGTGYIMLDGIVKNAKNNSTLKLSRIKNYFDAFRLVGNYSAHSITYTAGKKDIDDIKLNYRAMLEELFRKAGLTT